MLSAYKLKLNPNETEAMLVTEHEEGWTYKMLERAYPAARVKILGKVASVCIQDAKIIF